MVNNQRTSYFTINSYRKMFISIDTTEVITLHSNFNTDFFFLLPLFITPTMPDKELFLKWMDTQRQLRLRL